MDEGFLRLTCYVKGDSGNETKQVLIFKTDAGYRDTARMLVESGLCFIFNKNEIKVEGGFWTPASCQGESLMKRLCATGCSLY